MLAAKAIITRKMPLPIMEPKESLISHFLGHRFERRGVWLLRMHSSKGQKKERLSKPYCVYMKDGQRPFAFAGLWDRWTDKETGEIIDSFAIITTTPNSLLQKIGHHRSPVILEQSEERLWLDEGIPLNDVTALLNPLPGEYMNAYPISTDIKNPRVHGLELLQPTGERVEKEYDYELYSEIQLEGMGAAPARKRKNDE